MAGWEKRLDIRALFPERPSYVNDRLRLREWLEGLNVFGTGPVVVDFHPHEGHAGTAMEIVGHRFSEARAKNLVKVGGEAAFVVEAEENRLLVLTSPNAVSGAVTVEVDGLHASGPVPFTALPWPKPDSGEDGPPYSFTGKGMPSAGGGPSPGDPLTGTIQVLVVPCYPTDAVPANLATFRQNIQNTFDNVHTFYDQASYGQYDVQVTVVAPVALLQNAAWYHRQNGAVGYPNIDGAVLDQLMAECAQGAVNAGEDLDDFVVMAALINLPGLGVRAWGGWSTTNFAYNDGAGTNINLTTTNPISLIAARNDADWGRAAHELGHCIVSGGLVLGEDVYQSDLVDPAAATADLFDLMGSHDDHPLFSGFYMTQLGWYHGTDSDGDGLTDQDDVLELQWSRNARSVDVEIVAHGTAKNTVAGRYHLVRIKVAEGLDYFVEVRERPTGAQVYDDSLPVPAGSGRTGGVVVTKAIAGELNNNQQTRLITLLHDKRVLLTNDKATDPARELEITVLDDQVSTGPLVCRVRIAWAQQLAETPGGSFDLWITPWDASYQTDDIWVDRQPFGTYDFHDAAGNPTGNGDEPRPMEVNRFYARIRNAGADAANHVNVTWYSVTPPGVGDNGTWTPLWPAKDVGTVAADGDLSVYVNWTPVVGEHTCLQVWIERQSGEVSYGNNKAQENVFHFQPAASSVPEPVILSFAVRNPLDEQALVKLCVSGVPWGYHVYVPHRWLWLDRRGERRLDLLVVPTVDYERLRKEHRTASVRIWGVVPRVYTTKVGDTGVPASWMAPIGGLVASVTPKRRATVRISEDKEREKEDRIAVVGTATPGMAGQQLRVDLSEGDVLIGVVVATTDAVGHFEAAFDLRKTEGAEREATPRELHPFTAVEGMAERVLLSPSSRARARALARLALKVPRTYRVVARVLNASELAPTESNPLYFTR